MPSPCAELTIWLACAEVDVRLIMNIPNPGVRQRFEKPQFEMLNVVRQIGVKARQKRQVALFGDRRTPHP